MAKTASALIAVAAKEVGYNRYEDPEQGTKYGRWYAALTKSPWFGTTGVPYCAMFVSWCLHQLSIACLGCPTASCTSGLLTSARRAGKLLRCSELAAGDLILFSWTGGGYYAAEADHVGIVVANHGTWLETIEGNVSGCVKRCTRYPSNVVGGIRPSFDAEPKEEDVYNFKTVRLGSSGNEVMLLQSALNIRQGSGFALDGEFGPYTQSEVKRWQKAKGLYADGVCGPKTWPTVLGK